MKSPRWNIHSFTECKNPVKKMDVVFLALAVASLLSLSASCTLAEKNNGGDDTVLWMQSSDAGIYKEKCGMCHLDSGMGTGLLARRYEGDLALLENRGDLQGPFIETVVRNGFNTMFPISRAEVSDEQLQAIIRHLTEEE